MLPKKKRFSSEYTTLSILEYLYNNSQMISVSKFNIVTHTRWNKTSKTRQNEFDDGFAAK